MGLPPDCLQPVASVLRKRGRTEHPQVPGSGGRVTFGPSQGGCELPPKPLATS